MQRKFEDHFDVFVSIFTSVSLAAVFSSSSVWFVTHLTLSLCLCLFLLTLTSTQTHFLVIYHWLKASRSLKLFIKSHSFINFNKTRYILLCPSCVFIAGDNHSQIHTQVWRIFIGSGRRLRLAVPSPNWLPGVSSHGDNLQSAICRVISVRRRSRVPHKSPPRLMMSWCNVPSKQNVVRGEKKKKVHN